MRLALLALTFAAAGSLAAAQTTMRVSGSSTGLPVTDYCSNPAIDGSGQRVVYLSRAGHVVPGNTWTQVVLFERATGAPSIASLAVDGALANQDCDSADISPDGRFVVFSSEGDNLTAPDANQLEDVFVRDLLLGTTTRASLSSSGGEGDGASLGGSISTDGLFVAFSSDADDLVPSDTNAARDIFVREMTAQTTERANLSSTGQQASGTSLYFSISGDGRFVAFDSRAADLVPGDTNGFADIFVRDRLNGTTTRVSVSTQGVESDHDSYEATISTDGNWVTFSSHGTQLVPGDTNFTADVFLRDLVHDTTERVSVSSLGAEANSASYGSAPSADGRFVVFWSYATSLVHPDWNGFTSDIFVRDVQAGETRRASLNSAGLEGGGPSKYEDISADGRTVVFGSGGSTLVAGDANELNDVFLNATQPYGLVTTYCTAKTNSAGCASVITSAGFPRTLGDDAFFVVAADLLNQKSGVFFWGHERIALPFGGGLLCVQPPLVRTAVQSSGGNVGPADCSGTYSFHFSHAYMASEGLLPGDTLFGQFWSRDPGFEPPDNIGLSDAIQFTLAL